MTDVINVVIADDDQFVRLALTDLLGTDPAIEVVAEAGNGVEAFEAVRRRRVDVVLMDLRMPRADGLWATRKITALTNAPQVIVLTTFDADDAIFGALEAGAAGFLVKDTPPTEILRAIHVVAAGGGMLHPTAARQVIRQLRRSGNAHREEVRQRIARLTPRERDVLTELATGQSNAEIGAALGLRESTVKAHVTRILERLGAANRVQAAIIAYDCDLVPDAATARGPQRNHGESLLGGANV